MATIKAPFNFVPLSDKVFFPDWADKVSQDVPFEDGVSGTIELNITAQTPIYVRNGHTKDDADEKNENYASFSRTSDNRYFIPATSIKGCIRNVLEIMSFGKMTQVENSSFGLRDLNNADYRNQMKNICCGWLQQKGNGYILYDWGEPGRISVEAIDKKYNTRLAEFVKKGSFREDANKTAKYKYMITNAEASCKVDMFTKDEELQKAKLKVNKIEPRKFYKFGGNREGVLVFTGQPSQRKKVFDKRTHKEKWTGKYYEFVFLKPDKESSITLTDDLVKAFKTIHAESPDYKDFWAKKLLRGERIPVFFKKNGQEIHSVGLAYMYKYPFRHSVFDAIPTELKNSKKKDAFRCDLQECIFGYTYNENALRGRVQFGHAFVNGTPIVLDDKKFVSATPHPSFYPLYVQNGSDWNNASIISGRKRYPVRTQVDYNNEGTDNMFQVCKMLDKGASFTEKITFHNLKPIELGALISALTFHRSNENCYHNLGFGKAYGYGKIKISDLKLNFVDESIDYYLLEFEKTMGTFMESVEDRRGVNSQFAALAKGVKVNKWLGSAQLQELVAMATGIPSGKEHNFQYLKMSTNRNDNEFLQVKSNREFLNRYTKIIGRQFSVESVDSENHIPINKSYSSELVKNENVVASSADLKYGDIVNVRCIKPKVVRVDGHEYDIQLILPKTQDSNALVNKNFNARIKQISKAGKICQVEYVG